MRLHNGTASPPRDGGSTKLLVGVVIPDWDEQSICPYTALDGF